MRGYKRFRSGSWSLVVDAGKDPITGERRQVHRTYRAPNTKRGADTRVAGSGRARARRRRQPGLAARGSATGLGAVEGDAVT